MRSLRIPVIVVCSVLLLGATCQQKTPDVADAIGQTLMTMGIAYNSTLNALGNAYRLGLIKTSDVEKATEIAEKFRIAYNITVDLYIAWLTTRSVDDAQKLSVALKEASKLLINLRDYAKQLGVIE